jgi:hypothetical protein
VTSPEIFDFHCGATMILTNVTPKHSELSIFWLFIYSLCCYYNQPKNYCEVISGYILTYFTPRHSELSIFCFRLCMIWQATSLSNLIFNMKLPPQAVLVSDWSISKKSSHLKPRCWLVDLKKILSSEIAYIGQMNQNCVGGSYGRPSIRIAHFLPIR